MLSTVVVLLLFRRSSTIGNANRMGVSLNNESCEPVAGFLLYLGGVW